LDVIEAIRTRRSVNRMTDVAPSREDIAEILDAAVMAPNHGFTQPWKFYVVAGDERERISNRLAKSISAEVDVTTPEGKTQVEKAANILTRAPVVVAVTSALDDEDVYEREDFAATWMAVQNMMLAAWARGIASKVRTPPAIESPVLRGLLGVDDNSRILGLVFLGYPGERAVPPARKRDAETATWLGWS